VFTGIVRELGRVESFGEGPAVARLVIAAPSTAAATGLGDSVSVNGCCLTAVAVEAGTIAFEAVPETLARTTLGSLVAGASVNLEPALRAGEPLGGHYVQGHVDGVARVRMVDGGAAGRRIVFAVPEPLLRFVVEKGSVTVDGVSLTVSALTPEGFEVALIPHTLAVTTLGRLASGVPVNLEVDVLAKYVQRLMQAG
jgi:riboflavin synthase